MRWQVWGLVVILAGHEQQRIHHLVRLVALERKGAIEFGVLLYVTNTAQKFLTSVKFCGHPARIITR